MKKDPSGVRRGRESGTKDCQKNHCIHFSETASPFCSKPWLNSAVVRGRKRPITLFGPPFKKGAAMSEVDPRLVFLLRAAAKLHLIEAGHQGLDLAFSELVPAFRDIAVPPCRCDARNPR